MSLPSLLADIWPMFQHAGPVAMMLGLVLATLLLEEAAVALGAGLILSKALDPVLAFSALAFGIALGDMGLYWLGNLARRIKALHRRLGVERTERWRNALHQRIVPAVLLARMLPGLRLPTYSGAGYLNVPFNTFVTIVLLSVLPWTALLLFAGHTVLALFETHFGVSPLLGGLALGGLVLVLPLVISRLRTRA